MSKKYICIHGHFYQPPRENPWLERIELQESASPYHDWNERITEECYGPNTCARKLDGSSKLKEIVNNYAYLSFNFGPTLLSWMETYKPQVYRAILEADIQSLKLYQGHGAAIAQVYNHMIMPLANRRDKISQVEWGLEDFRHRFGRESEGIWLAETAVDLETLEILADHGIKYTILSPYQAKNRRIIGENTWQDAQGANIDPTQAYLQKLPNGKQIAIFFYDGPISQGIAFEKLLSDGKKFVSRLETAFLESRKHPQLVHIATDGETYGHHHAFGDMALAYAIEMIQCNPNVEIINYGSFLEKHPPTQEVQILENTAWSCSHGVARWQDHCGCNTGGYPHWNQSWRKPLRNALDWLRDSISEYYEKAMKEFTDNPWQVRNTYIQLMLNRQKDFVEKWFQLNAKKPLLEEERSHMIKLLEMQRHTLLMYTSCGWFFDELSGMETVQCIAYAARAIELAQELLPLPFSLESEFLNRLELAKSNVPEHKDGKNIYLKFIKPSMVDIGDSAAHLGIYMLFEEDISKVNHFNFSFHIKDIQKFKAGRALMCLGKVEICSRSTIEKKLFYFGALYTGGHAINAGSQIYVNEEEYDLFKKQCAEEFSDIEFQEIIKIFDRTFKNSTFNLNSLFKDDQRRIINKLLEDSNTELESLYNKMYLDNYTIMRKLIQLRIPLPRTFRNITNFVMDLRLKKQLSDDFFHLKELQKVLSDAKRWDYRFDTRDFSKLFKEKAERIMDNLMQNPENITYLAELEEFIKICKKLPFPVHLWKVQNDFYLFLCSRYSSYMKHPESISQPELWKSKCLSLGDLLAVSVPSLP